MNIFTYGSLMFPEVWQRVTGLTAPGRPAYLDGHEARRIRGQSYPALVKQNGEVTPGVLYADVSAEAVSRLDAFEGSFYQRVDLKVRLEDDRSEAAWVYLAADSKGEDIMPERWEAARFAISGLADFLREDPGFSGNGRD